MNCVDFAINQIVNAGDIPSYILRLAFERQNGNFIDNWMDLVNQNTVEQGIREKVIHATVLPRCHIQGGMIEWLDLTGSIIMDMGQGNVKVHVPDFITGGRKIISVMEIYQGAMNATSGILGALTEQGCGGGGALGEAQYGLMQTLKGNSALPMTYTRIQPLGNNTFVICGAPRGVFSMTAKVILESDDNLSHIAPQAIPYFATLCNHAVKAYIYKECRFPANEAVRRSGVPLESITDCIGQWSDAWANYEEYFNNEWLGYMNYSDRIRKADGISASVNGR